VITRTLLTIGIGAGAAMGDELLFDPLTSDSGHWNVTSGSWVHDELGMHNSVPGENRAFIDVLNGSTSYTVEVSATLHSDKGWGVWLSADMDAQDRVSGYTFQYDPGWSPDSYLLRRWEDGVESVLHQVDLDVEYGEAFDFRFEVEDASFRALQDGELIMSTDVLGVHDGDLVGFRTWSSSSATFSSLAVTAVPSPSGASVVLGALGVVMCARRRAG